MSATVRQALLDALHPEDGSDTALLDLLKKETSLVELFQAFPKKDYGNLWELLAKRLHRLVEDEHYCTPHASRVKELAVMDAVCSLAKCFVDEDLAKKDCPKALISTAQLLHGSMFKLSHDESAKLQNKISQLCETWWKQDLPQKSTLVPQTISYLLVRSVENTGIKADIIRVNQMKEGLMLLDFDDESGDPLKTMLLRCVISPLYLRCAEGRKFLSFAFTINLPFVDQLILTIKNQLPGSKNSLVTHYGEVLFRAWRLAQGQLLLKLEQSCLQHLIHCGIHVEDAKSAKAVRLVLSAFHVNKKQKGVDEMLHRLYGPILWRCMHVANPVVRRNAASLFIEAFPVQDPTEGVEQTEQLLQKQFQHLRDLVDDKDEQVRVVGVQGICRVLGVNWELIPPATIKSLVDSLIDRAFDGASFLVRMAVCTGLCFVLENVLTEEFLKLRLPALQPLVYDPSPRVQLAFLDLLLFVKKMRSIKFVDIVPVEMLLKRLEVSSAQVCVKITGLLMSYFPQDKPLAEQVKRGWALLHRHPHHGKLFFNYVHKHVSVESVLNLLNGFHQFLLKSDRDTVESDTKVNTKKKAKGEPAPSNLWQKEQTTVEALLCTMAQLWSNVRRDQATVYKGLAKVFEAGMNDLQELMGWFPSEVACTAILTMATFLPKQSSADLLPRLKKLPLTAPVSLYGPPIDCLISWNKGQEVVALVLGGLTNQGKTPIAPQISLKYLNYLMDNQRSRTWLMQYYESDKGATAELRGYLTDVPSRVREALETDLSTALVELELFIKLQIHLYALSPDTLPSGLLSVLDLMEFLFSSVLPNLASESISDPSSVPAPKRKKKTTGKSKADVESIASNGDKENLVVLLLKMCTELVTLGLNAQKFLVHVSRWMEVLHDRQQHGPAVSPSLLQRVLEVCVKLSVQMHVDPSLEDECYAFASSLLPLFTTNVLEGETTEKLRMGLTEILRTAKDRKSSLIRTVGLLLSFLLTERKSDATQAAEQVVVSTLVRVPAAVFCLPQVLEKLSPFSEPAADLSAWIGRVLERLSEFAQGATAEVSSPKGRAEFVQCLQVCIATLNLLQSDTADLQRGCLAAAAQQHVGTRIFSENFEDDLVFTAEAARVLQECSRPEDSHE